MYRNNNQLLNNTLVTTIKNLSYYKSLRMRVVILRTFCRHFKNPQLHTCLFIALVLKGEENVGGFGWRNTKVKVNAIKQKRP